MTTLNGALHVHIIYSESKCEVTIDFMRSVYEKSPVSALLFNFVLFFGIFVTTKTEA